MWKLTLAVYVRIAFETWWTQAAISAWEIFAKSTTAAGGARTLVVVVAANSRIAFETWRAAALVCTFDVSAHGARPATVTVHTFIYIDALPNNMGISIKERQRKS